MCVKKRERGLTLIEVLISLALISIAFATLLKVTTDNLRATTYLKEKTLATWLSLRILNEGKLGLVQFKEAPFSTTGQDLFFHQSWQWQASFKKTPNPHIYELSVQVFHEPEHRFLNELKGYRYV